MPDEQFDYYCSIASEEPEESISSELMKETLGEPMDEFDATFEALGCKIITPLD